MPSPSLPLFALTNRLHALRQIRLKLYLTRLQHNDFIYPLQVGSG